MSSSNKKTLRGSVSLRFVVHEHKATRLHYDFGPGDSEVQLQSGKLAFTLHWKKLKGGFALARFAKGQTGKEWLLMKKKDEYANRSWALKSELTPERLKALAVKIPSCETS